MPVSAYFGGHGDQVLRDMQRKHGKKKGTRMFYATANKHGQRPSDDDRREAKRRRARGKR